MRTKCGVVVGLLVACGPKPAGSARSACDAANSATWPACEGAAITLEGEVSRQVSQHPVVAAPMGPTPHQSYVDAGGAQVIVLTADAVTCAGKLQASGVLHALDLGGEPGTKESYRGWQLDAATVVCR